MALLLRLAALRGFRYSKAEEKDVETALEDGAWSVLASYEQDRVRNEQRVVEITGNAWFGGF